MSITLRYREWDEIFGPVSRRFFYAIDSIKHWDNNRKVIERRRYNLAHPESPKKVKQFKCEAPDPQDSSDNSTDDEWRSLAGFFDRSRCILPHAVLHLKSQVNLPEMFTWESYLVMLHGKFTCCLRLIITHTHGR